MCVNPEGLGGLHACVAVPEYVGSATGVYRRPATGREGGLLRLVARLRAHRWRVNHSVAADSMRRACGVCGSGSMPGSAANAWLMSGMVVMVTRCPSL